MKQDNKKLYESIMSSVAKEVKKSINEIWVCRAKIGNVLEVELRYDGHFFWHTPEDSDWERFESMEDWEINIDEMPERFFIKIGK